MLKQAVQQGRSEVHGAKHNERHVCGRRRVGEPAVSYGQGVPSRYVEFLSDARTPLVAHFNILH
jgi:hypothetical protein